jgi:hypothetical protein
MNIFEECEGKDEDILNKFSNFQDNVLVDFVNLP